jgi:GDP-L-fucose synthase
MSIDKSATTYVAGHRGLVGSAIWRRLEADGYTNLVGRTSAELDLRDREATFDLLRDVRPRYLILAAARVGGILANDQYPAEFLSDNLRVQLNVMDAAQETDVERLVFLGSSCIYPKLAPQPIKEEYLMTGPLEPTNDAYAIAKIAGILQVQSARKQYGRHWISAMPTNLYGPGDNFSPETSHVLPALIRRYVDAKETGLERVTNWGSGTPRREFLHVDDLARAIVLLMEEYDSPETINVGTGEDQSIREIAELVAKAVGYEGEIAWDTSKPDGMPRKLLDVERLKALGWRPTTSLEDGLRETVQWYHEHRAEIRS